MGCARGTAEWGGGVVGREWLETTCWESVKARDSRAQRLARVCVSLEGVWVQERNLGRGEGGSLGLDQGLARGRGSVNLC